MYLLIDWGNTRLKYLIVEELSELTSQPELLEVKTAASTKDLVLQLEQWGKKERLVKVLVASVRSEQDNQRLAAELHQAGLTLFIAKTSKHACEVECGYQNPQKLGIDRWLAIIAGYHPGQTVGIIDIGSAITLDIVDPQGMHLGGHILPGKRLLTNSLLNTAHVKADKSLPVSCQFELGHSTSHCVNFGVEQMILGYLIRSITESSQRYQVGKWYMTGGDGDYWLELLQNNHSFSHKQKILYRPALVFQGLAKLFLFQ